MTYVTSSSLSEVHHLEGKTYWKQWERACRERQVFRGNGRLASKDVELDFSKFTPENYLLSWVTAVAGIEVEDDGYTIVTPHNKFVNDNGNSWQNKVLIESYNSFILAENFAEHISLFDLSKGKVLDAVAWVVEKQFNGYREPIPTVFVDCLLATNKKKHPRLVKQILRGVMSNVSMGCLLPDGYVTMADGTQKEIQDVLVGDFVLTESGGAGEVTDVQIRDVVDEDIIVGNIVGITDKFVLTGEHPVKYSYGLQKSIKSAKKSNLILPHTCEDPTASANFFAVGTQEGYQLSKVKAGKKKLYVTETYPKEVWLSSEMITEDFAELLGMLAGNGYFCGKKGYETRSITNLEKVEIDARIRRLMDSCFGHHITLDHQECVITDWLQASDKDVTNLFKKFLLGKRAPEKKFSAEVLYWSHHLQKALLRGYFNTNGVFSDREILKGESRSKDLRDQIYLMLLRNGVVANRCKLLHKPTGYSKGDSYYMYIVTVGKGYNAEWMSDKVKISEPFFVRKSPTFFAQSFAMRKVRKFQKTKYTGKVYNLTVRDSHTYSHCGVVVHNCDILFSQCSRCGKIVEEGVSNPCRHIKEELGRYYEDKKGNKRRVAEHCGVPGKKGSCVFKELSWVLRPAFIWAKLHGFLDYSDESTGRHLKAIVPVSRYKESNHAI